MTKRDRELKSDGFRHSSLFIRCISQIAGVIEEFLPKVFNPRAFPRLVSLDMSLP